MLGSPVGRQFSTRFRTAFPSSASEYLDARLERRVQTTRIAVRQALQICLVECRITSNVGDGRRKCRFRHKWEIKSHQQLRYRHQFENGSELGLGGGCRQVVIERSDTFPDLLRGKLEPSSPHAKGVLKHLDPVDQVGDGATAVG